MTNEHEDNNTVENHSFEPDSKCSDKNLVKSFKGLLSDTQEDKFQDHLNKCERCRANYESLNLEMLLVINDDALLRKFCPNLQHAEKCLLSTTQRLERFSTRDSESEQKSEQEFITDQELEEHIAKCVYCRRRLIIVRRAIRYRDHLPLDYHLSEQAIKGSLDLVYQKVWDITFPQDKRSLELAGQGALPNVRALSNFYLSSGTQQSPKYYNSFSIKLSSGGYLDISVGDTLVRLQFSIKEKWGGRSIVLVSKDGQEFRKKLSEDARGVFVNLPKGDYQIVVSRDERYAIRLQKVVNTNHNLSEKVLMAEKAEKIETLDSYVKLTLDFFEENNNPTLELPKSRHSLVVGSQTGLLAGRIVYRFADRIFSHAKEVLAQSEIDAKRNILEDITIFSATGSRQVVPIAQYALDKELRVNAILCNDNSELKKKFGDKINFKIFSALEEPPTINISNYGSMIQAVTQENLSEIRQVVESLQEPEGGYGQFKAFSIILTDSMPEVAEMVDWKLRGENIGRCTGSISTHLTNFMHGAAINDANKELYIGLGLTQEEKDVFEQVLEHVPTERKYYIDVPDGFGPLGFMLLGYSVVGQIQENYPCFQINISNYKTRSKNWKWLTPIQHRK